MIIRFAPLLPFLLAILLGCTPAPETGRPEPNSTFAPWPPDRPLEVATFAPAPRPELKPGARPNVVVILTDDQRDDALGTHERPLLGIKTPHLDRLAAEGARFRNMFCTTSLCSPSRASFLSGLYAHSHRVMNNFTDFPLDIPNYPQRLREAGYETAYIGKWHMGEDDDRPRPMFDYWASHRGQGKYFDNEFNINGERRPLPGYYTTAVTQLAADWLKQPHDRPFCLIVGQKAPHGPFEPEEKYAHTYDGVEVKYPESAFQLEGKPDWIRERLPTWHGIYGPLYGFRKDFPDERPEGVDRFGAFVKNYTATINSLDDSVGAIYEALADAGQLDNTLFIYTSDNGFLLGEHGMIDKRTMHEESLRVPLIVRYPPLIKPGTVIEEHVLSIDVAPTIVDLCEAPPLGEVHGRSWRPLLAGEGATWRESWLYEYNYEQQFPYTPNVRGIYAFPWKYAHYPHGDGLPDRHLAELYNIADDPQERTNLIKDPQSAEIRDRLASQLQELLRATGAVPDKMPIDQGIKTELPDAKIR